MPGVQDVIKDPNFLALPAEEQRKVLLHVDPNFGSLAPPEQDRVLSHFSGQSPTAQSSNAPGKGQPPSDEYGSSGFEHYEAPPISQLLSGAAKSVPGVTGGLTGFEQYTPEELASGMQQATTPQTEAEQAGHMIGTTAQMLPWGAGAPEVAGKAAQAVGSRVVPSMIKQQAGKLFDAVAQDAGKVPVALERSKDAALRLMDMQRVTNLGPTVNKFLNRITKPGTAEMTYNEARDFYSALSEMSWGDRLTLNPKVQYLARRWYVD